VGKHLEPRLQRILADVSFAELGVAQDSASQQAIHCLEALEAKAAEAARSDLKRQIKQLEAEGKFEEALRLMEKLRSVGR
jgi:intergrase/recombinase